MSNFLLSNFLTPPSGKHSLTAQIGYCFTVILVILFVISNTISTSYKAILEQDRSDALLSACVSSALTISHLPLQEGMIYPIPTNGYVVNIYTKDGNSFQRVYSSAEKSKQPEEQIKLEGAGEAYRKAFDQQEAVVVERSDSKGRYVAAISPIIGAEGTVSGLLEILMPSSEFYRTENGISLSWVFTMIAISVALSIIYYEMHKLLSTMFRQPNRQLPKIIRYGLSGCQSVAFFSAMACTIPPLVISSFLLDVASEKRASDFFPVQIYILLGGVLFACGFFGFNSLREHFVRRFTPRIALIIFIFAAFVLLLISSVFENEYIYLLFLMPIGFCLGMVFYFQREYRIYASRLGYPEFSEKVIYATQYTGYVLGASVGAVMAGIVYERFGLLTASMLCAAILFIVGIQALLFVQHCPPSSNPPLHLPSFLYALSNKKSGTFIWSTIMTAGIQVAFMFLFIPHFLKSLHLSLATAAFYYMVFTFVSIAVVRTYIKYFPNQINMHGRVVISSVLQVAALLLLSISPSAKMLVVTILLMGAALGFHDYRFQESYKQMIREDKHIFARTIVERAYAVGAMGGSFLYGVLFLLGSMRLALFIFTFIMAFLLMAYPMVSLMYTSNQHEPDPHAMPHAVQHGVPVNRPEDPFVSPMRSGGGYVEPQNPYGPEQHQMPLYRPVPHLSEENQPLLYRPNMPQQEPFQHAQRTAPQQPDPFEPLPDKYLPPFENTKPDYRDPDDKDRGGWV
jgi:hypothetical protein